MAGFEPLELIWQVGAQVTWPVISLINLATYRSKFTLAAVLLPENLRAHLQLSV